MARIDYPDLSALTDTTERLLGGRPLINGLRMWAHAEPLLLQIAQLGATQLAELRLSPRHRELIVLAVANAMESSYVVAQHTAISASCGVTEAERRALALTSQWELSDATFTSTERALIRFAIAVLESPLVRENEFAGMRRHFSEQEIVETITIVGFYFTVARMTTTLAIENDASDDLDGFDTVLELGGVR